MNKIVVTGYGVKAPQAMNIEQFLASLREGACGLETAEGLGPKGETTIVGKVKDSLNEIPNDRKYKRLSRTTLLGMAAGIQAVNHANILNLKDKKVGLFFGVSVGNISDNMYQESVMNANTDNYKAIPVTFGHNANYHSIAAAIGHFLGVDGITKTITTACTSSLEAIQDASVYLKSGLIDVAIVGGADTSITKVLSYGFAKTKVLPLNQRIGEGAVPFDKKSNGFAMAEGAGMIVLEREEDALAREACIYGEIDRVSSNNDGVFVHSLDGTGKQMIKALKEVTDNRIPDYVNSQALGIQLNDQIEKKCSATLFSHQVPYTSIKSMIGNPMGAIGVIQVISSLLSINQGFIPPTIKTRKEGYEEMNIVTETLFQQVTEVAITNHGYGGNNACAYVKKYKRE